MNTLYLIFKMSMRRELRRHKQVGKFMSVKIQRIHLKDIIFFIILLFL